MGANNKAVHVLLEKDPERRRGVCARCGPVQIVLGSTTSAGNRVWRCATQATKRHRVYLDDRCSWCLWVPLDPCQLEIDHIDCDRSNNEPSNYQTLCANCHALKTWSDKQKRLLTKAAVA